MDLVQQINDGDYYIYTHSIDGRVFYIGSNWSKCNENRAYERNGRPKKWHEIVDANDGRYDVNIVSRHKESRETYRAEYKMIEKYHDMGLAEASGEDQRGKRNPMWGRRGELSPFYGMKRPESVKRRVSEANKGRYLGSKSVLAKKVEVTFPNGETKVFGSLSECAEYLGEGVQKTILSKKANSGDAWNPRKYPEYRGATFRYLTVCDDSAEGARIGGFGSTGGVS